MQLQCTLRLRVSWKSLQLAVAIGELCHVKQSKFYRQQLVKFLKICGMSSDANRLGIWAEWLKVLLALSVAMVLDCQLACVAEFFCCHFGWYFMPWWCGCLSFWGKSLLSVQHLQPWFLKPYWGHQIKLKPFFHCFIKDCIVSSALSDLSKVWWQKYFVKDKSDSSHFLLIRSYLVKQILIGRVSLRPPTDLVWFRDYHTFLTFLFQALLAY